MIVFPPYPIPVIADGQEGYVVYIRSNSLWENDEVCVALCDGGQWRHYNSGQIKSYHNATYGIIKQQQSNQ